MRDYIGDNLHIDGRMIVYRLVTATDYFAAKGLSRKEIDEMVDKNNDVYRTVNQIMALKQSCFLLRRTSHSCQSLSDDLYRLKVKLIRKLKEKYDFVFDDEFVERNGIPLTDAKAVASELFIQEIKVGKRYKLRTVTGLEITGEAVEVTPTYIALKTNDVGEKTEEVALVYGTILHIEESE